MASHQWSGHPQKELLRDATDQGRPSPKSMMHKSLPYFRYSPLLQNMFQTQSLCKIFSITFFKKFLIRLHFPYFRKNLYTSPYVSSIYVSLSSFTCFLLPTILTMMHLDLFI